MPRRPHPLALLTALVMLPMVVLAQETPPATTAPTPTTIPPPAKQATEVQGTVPTAGLLGRWLVVSAVKTPDGKVKPAPRVWQLRQGADHVEMVFEYDALPQRINEELNAAGMQGTGWTPSEDDLREIADHPPSDTAPPADIRSIQSKLIGSDALPPELQEDETTKGAQFVILAIEGFSGRQGMIKNIASYAVREQAPTTLTGSFVNTAIAAAPLPIPITLKGDFKAYKLGAPTPKPWWQRLFSGCQRG
jgi:hypothetical protein